MSQPTSSPEAGAAPASESRLAQVASDLYQRSRLGAAFYLAAWWLTGSYAGAFEHYPFLAWGLTALLVTQVAVRLLHRPPRAITRQRLQRWTALTHALVLGLSGLWGAIAAWVLLDPQLAPGRSAALICTLAFGTAFAHNYALSARLVFGGLALLFLPAAILIWFDPALRPEAVVFAFYTAYLAAVAQRSRREYQARLDLDQELREQRDRYVELSHTDSLTGLANRREFVQRLATAIETAQHGRRALSLMLIDLDHFKAINDRHGHAVGDACLVACAALLRRTFPPAALMARVGGEEFAVLLDGHGEHEAERHAAALLEALRATRVDGQHGPVAMTASIGIAEFDPARHRPGDGLYRAVDAAMYRAKAEGRDRIVVDRSTMR